MPSTDETYSDIRFAEPLGYVDANQKDDYGNVTFILKRFWIKLQLFEGTLEDFAANACLKSINEVIFYPSLGNILCNDVHYYLMPMINLLSLARNDVHLYRCYDLLQTDIADVASLDEA